MYDASSRTVTPPAMARTNIRLADVMCATFARKSPFPSRKRLFRTIEHHKKPAETGTIDDRAKSPSPSLVGQTAIVDQAVLLTPAHRSPAPSQSMRFSDFLQAAHCYSGGTAPAFSGFPIKSCDT